MLLSFIDTIQIRNGNPYILVHAAQAKALKPNWRKPMPVLVQINGQPKKPWHINMMPVGNGDFYLYLHGDVRKASGTKVGDSVKVHVRFDTQYRNGPMHPLPLLFKSALQKNNKAKQAWSKLIPSRKKEILRYFSFLKSTEALNRNVAKAIGVLAGVKERFMGRSWNE